MIRLRSRDKRHDVAERERFLAACNRYADSPHVLLGTCNRVELYSGDGETDPEIVRHLFRVTAGLESAFIGERHIQGQVKRAYLDSIEGGYASAGLHRLFQAALRVGKVVRRETGISEGACTYSAAVLDLLADREASIGKASIADAYTVIVGVNLLTANIARGMHSAGYRAVRILNRTPEKAEELAGKYGYGGCGLDALNREISRADIIICATSSEDPLIGPDCALSDRGTTIVDLAVPRNVDALVSRLPGVTLVDCAEIESRMARNILVRQADVSEADDIIDSAVLTFCGQRNQGRSAC